MLVHKFVCRGTVEERIDAMIRDKQSVADQMLNQESETRLTEMSDEELLRFVTLDIAARRRRRANRHLLLWHGLPTVPRSSTEGLRCRPDGFGLHRMSML